MSEALPETGEFVCHGLTWATGAPRLLLAPADGGQLLYSEVMGRRLGFRTGSGRWCTGRYQFTGTVRVEAVACPDRAPADGGGQCSRCASRDDFRFAHSFHHGGHAPEALRRYMAQPHWLYLATFPGGLTKVGTVAEPRKHSRLAEQGPQAATYVARAADGREVRFLEDALSSRLKVPQTVRTAAKIQALTEPTASPADVEAAHAGRVAQAAAALTDMRIPVVQEAFSAPVEGELLRSPGHPPVRYPHELRDGEHGFTVRSLMGPVALVVLDDDLHYVLDLGALKGCRLTLGAAFSSASTVIQSALF